jgi:hypothetical protein
MPVFTRVAATAIVLGAAMLAAPFASAQGRPGDEISEAIHKAGAKHEPIVTKANKALIARKCGYKDEYDDRNTNIQNGTLICADGKRVSDDETRAMAKRVSERADKYVEAVMSDPAVKRAIDGTAQREAKKAIEKAQKALARAGFAKR